MFYSFIRKAFFCIEPEFIHNWLFHQLSKISGTPLEILIRQNVPEKPVTCMGLTFKNPIGLAAGLDKNGEYINLFNSMGFGFIEIGTVTPFPQEGNDKPRLFRIPEAEGLINRMGFNNCGIDFLIKNIKKAKFSGILGVNIGKNKNTSIKLSKNDYVTCMEKLYPYVSYITINISSPNTLGVRMLQFGKRLDDLLEDIKNKQDALHMKNKKYVPLVVKISPDLSEKELTRISDSLIDHNIDGVIATNTTIDRELIYGINNFKEKGGLSGRPLQLKSTKIIYRLSKRLKGRLPIIGVGGVDSIISAREKISAGATLLQLYTGLIYKGPKLIKDIVTYI